MGLINTLFFWGLLTVSIPIIIHLLFKRQFKTISWAAMQFLKEAENRMRKRLRLIEILLLLIRCAILLLLTFLFGKIYINYSGVFHRLLGEKPIIYHILLDNSSSMNLKEPNSPFQTSTSHIKNFIKALCEKNEESYVSLYLTSNPMRPLFQKVLLNYDNFFNLSKNLDEIQILAAPLKPEQALSVIQEQISKTQEPYFHTLRVYSDFKDADWSDLIHNDLKSKLATQLTHFENIYFFDSYKEQKNNLAITDIKTSEKQVLQNVPLKFYVEIANYSTTVKKDIQVTMNPANSIKITKSISEIRPNEKQIVDFTYTFKEAGQFEFSWEIVNDELNNDNLRFYAVKVSENIEILIVDGDSDRNKNQTETKYLQMALAPPGDTVSGNKIITKNETEFEITPLDSFDIIYLCNVYHISPKNIQALTNWVQAGGNLIITLGDQIDYTYYNEFLYANGDGILPSKIEKLIALPKDVRAHFYNIDIKHPIFNSFNLDDNNILYKINFYAWWSVALPENFNGNVLARFDNEGKHPAILEKRIEKGKVLLFTSTIDNDWNNWPSEFSYLIVQLDLIRYCANEKNSLFNLIAGETIKIKLNANTYQNKIYYIEPSTKTSISLVALQEKPDENVYLFHETQKAGFAHFVALTNKEQKEEILFSCNLAPKEGALEHFLMEKNIKKLAMPNIFYEKIDKNDNIHLDAKKNELWKMILVTLVCLMLAETTIAWYFGGKR